MILIKFEKSYFLCIYNLVESNGLIITIVSYWQENHFNKCQFIIPIWLAISGIVSLMQAYMFSSKY